MGNPRQTTRPLLVLVLVLLLDLLSFTCILPLLPAIFEQYAKNKEQDWLYSKFESTSTALLDLLGVPHESRYNNVFFAGIIGSLFSMLQYISSPFLGALSDLYGRKPVFLITVLGSLLSYAAFVGICFSLAFMFGPMMGAWFASQARQTGNVGSGPAHFAIALTVVELVILALGMPETRTTKDVNFSSEWTDFVNPAALIDFRPMGKDRPEILKSYGLVYFLYLLIYSGCEFTISFLTHIRFGYTSVDQGKMYFFTGILMILIQGGFVRRLGPGRESRAALAGLSIIVPTYALMALAHSLSLFYTALACYAVGFWLLGPQTAYALGGALLVGPALLFHRTNANRKAC